MTSSKQIRQFILTLILLILTPFTWAKNSIEGVRIWPSPSSTRVVLDLKDSPDFSYFTLKNPERLVVDIDNTSRDIDFSRFSNDSKLLTKIRHSTPKNKNAVRIVFELSQKLNKQVFALPPTAPYGNRLVIDLQSDSDDEPQRITQVNNSQRDIVIAIDAGHGGEDPGSIGFKGSHEKNVTLSVAKLLADLVNKEQGMKATLTRTGDYYVDLNKRTAIARKREADVFVSIHADAFTTPQPSGGSVWVLSMRRANTELGRWIEKREKHSELLGGAAEVIQNTANERYLTQALLDMSMDHSLATSYDLSKAVIREMKQVTKMHKKVPQAASLGVLTSPDIPSILVETGFISNPTEEKNLNWHKHRERLAGAIFEGLRSHFKKAPPDGTLWAKWKQENRTHKVRSGESLSLLAQRYNVSVSEIKSANNLNTDVVRIGQVLNIPRS